MEMGGTGSDGQQRSMGGVEAVWRSRHVEGVEVVRGAGGPYRTPRHFHAELEVGMTQGSGWDFYHRRAWQTVAAGGLVLTPPGDVHMVRAPGGARVVYRGLRLDADLFQHAATDLLGRPQRAPDVATPLIQDRDATRLFLRLVAVLDQGEGASRLEQGSRLQDLLERVILYHGDARLVLPPVGAEHGAIRRARHYLEEHAAQDVTLAELTRVAGLSASHLCRVFSAAVGMPPHAYQTQVRVLRAKALLVTGHLPLAQVAVAVGFANQSHLTHHFARLVGVTPGRYLRDSR